MNPMTISEAIDLIESSGLVLERINKYRTTREERNSRDHRSSTDNGAISGKLRKIIRDNGLESKLKDIKLDDDYQDKMVWDIRFELEDSEIGILSSICKSLGIEQNLYSDAKFVIPVKKKQSHWQISLSDIVYGALKDEFNVPLKISKEKVVEYEWILDRVNDAYKDDHLDRADSEIKDMYNRLERWIEKEQYGGVQNLTYNGFRNTIYAAMDKYESADNKDRYVTNQYGKEKALNKMYSDFSKLCRIFSREINRQRGPYRPVSNR